MHFNATMLGQNMILSLHKAPGLVPILANCMIVLRVWYPFKLIG